MSENTKTIRIKWVRSGIGFTHFQKTIVRSLGLRKLNQVVVRPDTAQTRGIVAAVPHLLTIVPEPVSPAWASIPEYTVIEQPKAEPAPAVQPVEASTDSVAAPESEDAAVAPAAEAASTEAKVPRKKAVKVAKKPAAAKAKPAAHKDAKPKKTAKK